MYVVRGAREIARGGADPSTLGVRAPDERTLEVQLVRRTPYFLQLLCMNLYFPVHRPTVERFGPSWWTKTDEAVVNGPYRMSEWKLKERKTFVRNPAYRAAGDVKLAKFVFLAVEKAETAFSLYETGACHWLFRIPLGFVDLPRPDHRVNPYNVVYYYAFNVRKKPLDDPRVRRALGLVLEREKIAKHILRGGETPADRFVPPPSR
jgi:oligopeptide transport system substrate-binding protein